MQSLICRTGVVHKQLDIPWTVTSGSKAGNEEAKQANVFSQLGGSDTIVLGATVLQD